jgi:hypothetical protein
MGEGPPLWFILYGVVVVGATVAFWVAVGPKLWRILKSLDPKERERDRT